MHPSTNYRERNKTKYQTVDTVVGEKLTSEGRFVAQRHKYN